MTSLQKRAGIDFPGLLVEIYRNKPARIILQQWIDAYG
jgi:hypothetical protein